MNTIRWASFVCVLCASVPSYAQSSGSYFTIETPQIQSGTGDLILQTFTPSLAGRVSGSDLDKKLNASMPVLASDIADQINQKLANMDFLPLVQSMSDAAAFAARTDPVDYATRYRIFSLTGVAGASSNLNLLNQVSDLSNQFDGIQNGNVPNFGLSTNVSAVLGINLAAFHLPQREYFDPDRVQLYVDFMKFGMGYDSDKYQLDMFHIGVHGKYQLIRQRELVQRYNMLHWGGLNVVTGFSYASQTLTIGAALPGGQTTATQLQLSDDDSVYLYLNYAANGNLSLKTQAYSIPIELVSSLQLAYVFTLYGGVAADFAWGKTSLIGAASEPVVATVSDTSDPSASSKTLDILSTQASLYDAQSASPTAVSGRALLGLQLNMGVLALFAQGNIATTHTVSASVGLRAFW